MRVIPPIFAFLMLAGCASTGGPHAAMPHGPWHLLNAGQWDINPTLVSMPPEKATP